MTVQPAVDRGRILFGAAYYPEYQPDRDPIIDLDLMQKAGITVIRVAESVWSTWEPRDGEFDLDWLAPTLDAAHERGISVVFGTPTYAVPMWLARKHPSINAEKSTGLPMGWGRRQEIDYLNTDFRAHAERIIRKVVERYAAHPAVIGFQVDNEPGIALLHNDGVFERFRAWLQAHYGTVERLNEEWGLVYWSHRLSDWSELWRPDGNAQPQYDLAWRRFQAQALDEFIAWQAAIVREYATDDQFVTTCYSYFVRPAMNDESCSRSLDIVSGNAYFRTQDSMTLPSSPVRAGGLAEMDGAWRIAFSGDRMYSGRQAPFLVTETNAGSIGPQSLTEPPWDGQWRQIAWLLVARGAQMIEYWHWQTLQYGAETYWHGILPHDREPGRVYENIEELGRELEAAGDAVTGLRPRSDIGFLLSYDSRWATEFSPFVAGALGDVNSVQFVLQTLYRAAYEQGLESRMVHVDQLVGSDGGLISPELGEASADRPAVPALDPADVAGELPVLVAAGITVLSDEAIAWLRRYVEVGGHLVLGPRTGYHDEETRARDTLHPAGFADLAGVDYAEYSTLSAPVALASGEALESGAATAWIDYLRVRDADVLARYASTGFGAHPAVTTRAVGSGRITVVGTVPDSDLASALVGHVARQRDAWSLLRGGSVTVASADTPSGDVVRVVHNWSWNPANVVLPSAVTDAVSGGSHAEGESLRLGAWDVRVFVDTAGAAH